MEPGQDTITLRLHAKDGEQIDAGEIQKCLDYTVGQLRGEPTDS